MDGIAKLVVERYSRPTLAVGRCFLLEVLLAMYSIRAASWHGGIILWQGPGKLYLRRLYSVLGSIPKGAGPTVEFVLIF